MSSEEKQEYLRTNILEGGFKAEEFVSFLEGKKEDGSNLDNWDFEDLQEVVQEFKTLVSEGETIERRQTTKDQTLALFGQDTESEKDDNDDKQSSSSSSSNDSDEYKTDKQDKKKKQKDDKDNKKEESSSSSSSDDEEEDKKKELNQKDTTKSQIQADLPDDFDDIDIEGEDENSGQKYHSKKDCLVMPKTQLIGAHDLSVTVSEPETIKGKGIKSSYTVYSIKMTGMLWEVKRRYSDFEWLQKCLEKRFPANYVNFFLFIFKLILIRFQSSLQSLYPKIAQTTLSSDFTLSRTSQRQY